MTAGGTLKPVVHDYDEAMRALSLGSNARTLHVTMAKATTLKRCLEASDHSLSSGQQHASVLHITRKD